MTRRAACLALAGLALGCARRAPAPPPRPAVTSAAAVADRPGSVILHVGRDRAAYDSAHIPGARFLPLGAIVTERDGLPNELPDVALLDSVFESLGVSDEATVVLYGEPLAAARAFLTLDYLGLGDRAWVLDGGLAAWGAAGRPVATAGPEAVPRARLTPRPRADLLVDAAWVAARLDAPGVALVDARPAAEYQGREAGGGVDRPGHIPGAGSLFWRQTLVSEADPRLLPEGRLRELLAGAGVGPGDTVVAYCRTGVQASHLYLVARHLGFEVRMYDGSYVDWSRRAELPVARR